MRLTKKQKIEIKKAIELEFCKALNNSRQLVTDAMNAGPCFLGSKKYFEYTVSAIEKALKS